MTEHPTAQGRTAPVVPKAAPLREALEREHRAIDGGIEQFVSGLGDTTERTHRLLAAIYALRRHIYLEEEFLFPPLRAAGLLAPVFVMLSEHRELWTSMDSLERQLTEGAAPADLDLACTKLLAQLDRHNSKEEPILYSQADTALSVDAQCELEDFIAHEELPDGWVCVGL